MVKYKKIDAKTVLQIVAEALGEHLPDYDFNVFPGN